MQNHHPNSTKVAAAVGAAASNRALSTNARHEEGMAELRSLLRAVWERRIIVLLVAVVCLVGVAAYCFRATPLYRAVATIEVPSQEQNIIGIQEVNKLALDQLDVLNTLVIKSTRATVLKRVVDINSLADNPAFFTNGAVISASAVLAQVASAVKSTLRRNTRLIDITAVHPDPQMAQLLANGVATQFIRQEAEDQMAGVRFANAALLEEADKFKNELERSERALQNYREQNKTVSLEDRQNISDQKLHLLAQQLNDARSELTQLVAQQKQARAMTNTEQMIALPEIKKDAVVAGLQTQVAQQETLVNFYSSRYKEKYPKMIEARQRLEELKHSVSLAALAARRTLDSVVEAARAQVQGLEKAFEGAQQESLTLSRLFIDYNILQRQVDSNRNLYQSILQRLKETDVSKGIEKTSMQLIEKAGLPPKPFWPNRILLLLGGTFGGLVLGVALALFLAQFDQTFKTADEAEGKLGMPVVGHLVFDRHVEKAGKMLVMNRRNSVLAEGFRTLRANVSISARSEARKVVLFTSSVANEGKTMSASNYALASSQQSVRTVLVDLDLRRPRVGKAFGLKLDVPGVSNFLLGQASLETIAHQANVPNLDIIPAGLSVPNPAEQLAGPWIERLIKDLRAKYDVVVLDTAPINPVSDTLTFVRLADVVLLVVCGRYTSAKTAQSAVAALQRAGVRPSGLVLNRVASRQTYYDYNYVYADTAEVVPNASA